MFQTSQHGNNLIVPGTFHIDAIDLKFKKKKAKGNLSGSKQ
jgi:hypothetical protein